MMRKQDILDKYQTVKPLCKHPCFLLLSAYKRLSKPFDLKHYGSIDRLINMRAYRVRTDLVMANAIAKFKNKLKNT